MYTHTHTDNEPRTKKTNNNNNNKQTKQTNRFNEARWMTTSDTRHTKRHQTATRAAGSTQIEDRRRGRQRQPTQRRGCTAPASNTACAPHVFARPLLSGRPQPSLSKRRTVSGYTLNTRSNDAPRAAVLHCAHPTTPPSHALNLTIQHSLQTTTDCSDAPPTPTPAWHMSKTNLNFIYTNKYKTF